MGGLYGKWNKSNRKTNTVQTNWYVESKQNKCQTHRCREHIGGCQRSGLIVEMGEMGEWDQKAKIIK